MNKKILAVAIAGALSAPSAFAATDTSGMQYTSASEGFYASIRLRFLSAKNGHDNSGADIENGSSRIGVRGSNDLGGGLEGYYQWELGVNTENGSSAGSTRIGHVGLRGGWGDLMVGSGWTAHYNMTHGTTDVANTHSGNLNYNTLLPGRANKMIQYTSPNLNGFQAAIAVQMHNSGNGREFQEATGAPTVANGLTTVPFGTNTKQGSLDANENGFVREHDRTGSNDPDGSILYVDVNNNNSLDSGDFVITPSKDENDIDVYMLTAKYEVQGFSAAVGYSNQVEAFDKPGGTSKEDATALVYKLGYAQDNWNVNGWYATDNSSDRGTGYKDDEMLSLAAGVEVGKVNLYAVYEALERQRGATSDDKVEDEFTTVGVQYNLGARSRVWVEYAGRDRDSNTAEGDFINIGLRHDF